MQVNHIKKIFIILSLVIFIWLATTNLFWKDWSLKVQIKRNQTQKSLKQGLKVSSIDKKAKGKIIIIFYSLFFGSVLNWDFVKMSQCPIPCEVTSNKSKVQNASALIIHARDPYPLPPTSLNNTPWILMSWENPVHTPVLSNAAYLKNFNYLLTYNLDKTDFYLPTFPIPSIKPLPIEFTKKSGLVFVAFSNCEPARTAYLKELMKHIKVDSYGACLKNMNGLTARYQGDFKKKKIELSRRYKFTLVFHNQDCDYFVDDQLQHALDAGSVPVYLGTEKVNKLLGGNLRDSIIKVKDFKTPKKLAEYLTLLSENENLYNRYLRWKYEGFQFSESFKASMHGNHWLRMENKTLPHVAFCAICEKLMELKLQGKPFKERGLIEAEKCQPRKIEDWLKIE